MNFMKKNYSVFLFFLFMVFLLLFLISDSVSLDPLREYGMSHAIRIGEIPYKDFNTVSTPLFIFLFSLGLFLYDSFSVFLLEGCLLYTGIYYCLKEILGKHSWLVVLAMCVFLFLCFLPTYNSMAFFFIVLLMMLEKKGKTSDLVMGIILGCLILSKHTIGVPVFLCTCLGMKDWKRIWKRVEGCLIPGVIFILYLLITGSFVSFFDLCFFGLLDFGGNNRLFISWCVILGIVCFLATVYGARKDSKNILWYYTLGSIFFIIPICDMNHFSYYFPLFVIPFIERYKDKIKYPQLSFVFIGLFVILNILLRWNNITHYTFSPFDHFQGTRMYEPAIPVYQELLEKTEDYPNVIMIDVSGMFYEIVSNRKIDYFGVALRGNYGYGGTKKMISQMEAMENTYFVVNEAIYEDVVSGKPVDSQFDTELIEYVIKHYEKAGQTEIYTIYYKQ